MKPEHTWPASLMLCTLLILSSGLAAQQQAEPADYRRSAPSTAKLDFDGIKDGDTVGTEFRVGFVISGMGIAPAGSDIPNTGHHHLLIDLAELPDMNLPLPMSDQVRHFGGGQTETTLSLPPGEHTLQLLFADYAHIPHDPPVISERITITVVENP